MTGQQDPISAAELVAAIRAAHREGVNCGQYGDYSECRDCGTEWPCPPAVAADRIENALSQSHNCNDSTRYLCCKVGMGYRAALDGGDRPARPGQQNAAQAEELVCENTALKTPGRRTDSVAGLAGGETEQAEPASNERHTFRFRAAVLDPSRCELPGCYRPQHHPIHWQLSRSWNSYLDGGDQ